MKLVPISIKRTPDIDETWVQKQIAADPTILGLGDLVLKDKERVQLNAGRLDLLLQDPETLKRYEVEVQLGATDESHLVRTIEYWDIERRRYPQYEHAAIIVAEDITSRFLNVIQLFNGHIPLIALKLTAYKIGDDYALTFVKVLDELSFGLVDEDEAVAEPTDRTYWENNRGSIRSLKLTDHLLSLVNIEAPTATLKYNKHYIGLEINGMARNFVSFYPRKAHLIMAIKLPKTSETDAIIDDCGLDTLSYETRWRQYRIKIESELDESQRESIGALVKEAIKNFGANF